MQKAVEILQNSGVILTPTDTTFGLSCLAFDTIAVDKINQIKLRPNNKTYILLVENEGQLQRYVEVPDLAWDLMDLSEKPISIIYDRILDLPAHLISPDQTIAIRVVSHPLLQKIIQKVKQPLISTSANIAGTPAPKSFGEISNEILNQVDYILPESRDFKILYESSSLIQIGHDHKIKVIRA